MSTTSGHGPCPVDHHGCTAPGEPQPSSLCTPNSTCSVAARPTRGVSTPSVTAQHEVGVADARARAVASQRLGSKRTGNARRPRKRVPTPATLVRGRVMRAGCITPSAFVCGAPRAWAACWRSALAKSSALGGRGARSDLSIVWAVAGELFFRAFCPIRAQITSRRFHVRPRVGLLTEQKV